LSDGLERFNRLPRDEAVRRLYGCLASHQWASRIVAQRPFSDVPLLLAAADRATYDLTSADWLAAFAAHPRIGERGGHSPATSEREQSQIGQGDAETLAELAGENLDYEAHFGHVFLIAASGRTAAEILEALRRRMDNDPEIELGIAAEEHRKITRLRLESLLSG
jgi:OHCU decarboxylase